MLVVACIFPALRKRPAGVAIVVDVATVVLCSASIILYCFSLKFLQLQSAAHAARINEKQASVEMKFCESGRVLYSTVGAILPTVVSSIKFSN